MIAPDPLTEALGAPAPAPDLAALEAELAKRADAAGLLDAAFSTIETPLGELLVAATDAGVVRLALPGIEAELVLAELAATVGPRLLERPDRFDAARRQFDEYFAGRRQQFTLPLDRRLIRGFARRVLTATAGIPYGETRSYGEVAGLAGSPRAHRAAGSALGGNPLPLLIPCHRVLRSGGGLGGYGGGLGMKRALLALEGVRRAPRSAD